MRFILALFVCATAHAATIDLATPAGVAQVNGQWRYCDVTIVGNDITPQAGSVDFDDSRWEAIEPTALNARRGAGRLCFAWYRINVTLPAEFAGQDVAFSTSVDDYAEVWVDGELARAPGAMITGWNTENKVIIARRAKAGQKVQLAIFAANGPLSDPPPNYIWMRHARLEASPSSGAPVAVTPCEVNVRVIRHDPGVDAIVPANPKVYKLAEGFQFTEGPVWVRDTADALRTAHATTDAGVASAVPSRGFLLFSDPNANRIYRYDGALTVFRENSGYEGADIAEYRQPGSNGLTIDKDGRLTVNQHGNRRVVRLEKDGSLTVLADKYEGKRLNSPNDLVYRSDGTLYFTDPFFGLPKFGTDPRKELPYQGVYIVRVASAVPSRQNPTASAEDSGHYTTEVRLVAKDVAGPNGLAFSPDEKFFYLGNWEDNRKVVMRYEVAAGGSLSNGQVFFDMTSAPGEDAIDGIKVDQAGNLYVSGPGGLWIISPAAKHLGTIITPRHVHNMAWGDAAGQTLYLCARDRLYRMRLNIPGVRP
jgi:gluconolactonase